jgi:hypothetical protein
MSRDAAKTGWDFSAALISLGVLLIVASLVPLPWLSRNAWSQEDSKAMSFVSQEMHHPRSVFSTKAERDEHHAKMKEQFDRLKTKLEFAQQEPQRWSRIMLWSGAALAGVGVVVHLAQRKE